MMDWLPFLHRLQIATLWFLAASIMAGTIGLSLAKGLTRLSIPESRLLPVLELAAVILMWAPIFAAVRAWHGIAIHTIEEINSEVLTAGMSMPEPFAGLSALSAEILQALYWWEWPILLMAIGLMIWTLVRWVSAARSVARVNRLRALISGQSRRRLASVPGSVSPFVAGWWRPVIVWPSAFCNNLDSRQRIWILRHEKWHVQRLDPLRKLVISLSLTSHAWNPMFVMMTRSMERLRELAADRYALGSSHAQAERDYARMLVRFSDDAPTPMAPVGVIGATSELAWRVRKLLSAGEAPSRVASSWWLGFALVACALWFTGMRDGMQAGTQEMYGTRTVEVTRTFPLIGE